MVSMVWLPCMYGTSVRQCHGCERQNTMKAIQDFCVRGVRTVNGEFTIRNMQLITRANKWRR